MIFLTVGSELAFDRLVKAVDHWCGLHNFNEVFGQIADKGPNGYRPLNFEYTEFISPEEYCRRYEEAELIVGHAGMGSIITALAKAKAENADVDLLAKRFSTIWAILISPVRTSCLVKAVTSQ